MIRAAVLALVVLAASPATAVASFPGLNGQIVHGRYVAGVGRSQLHVVDPDGLAGGFLPLGQTASEPAWSPNGKNIAYVARDETAPFDTDIYVVDDSGGAPRLITDTDADEYAPAWSPEGDRLVFERVDEDRTDGDSSGDLVIADVKTRRETLLTATRDLDMDPSWSSLGRIAFVRDPVIGAWELRTVEPDGTDPRLVEASDVGGGPDWAPDGRSLAFRTTSGGVALVRADGTARREIGVVDAGDPAFSPDGTRVVYARTTATSSGELVIARVDGSASRTVTANLGGGDRDPSWQPLGQDATIIIQGPRGAVQTRDAGFEFASPGAVIGRHECRLDGVGEFSWCASGIVYHDLTDGEHRFEVRHVPAGGSAGPVSARSWLVDATPPTAVIESSPSGDGNPPDAVISFRAAGAEDATFQCALDGETPLDCSSPHRLSGLASGPHRFELTAADALGNVSAPAIVTWSVAVTEPPPPPKVACRNGGRDQISFGVVVVRPLDAARCLTNHAAGSTNAFATAGPVLVNGLRITPAPGTLFVAEPRLGDGTVLTTGPSRVAAGPADFELKSPLRWSGLGVRVRSAEFSVLSSAEKWAAEHDGGLRIAGLPVTVVPTLELSADNGGQTKMSLKLGLPTYVFRPLPGPEPRDEHGLTLEFGLTASNDKGVSYAGKATVAEAWLLGRWKLTDVELSIDSGPAAMDPVIEGAANLSFGPPAALPAGRPEPGLRASISLGANGFLGPVRRLSLQRSSLNKPLGSSSIFLQRLGGEFSRKQQDGIDSLVLTANAGVSWGPEIDIGIFKGSAISLDGRAELTLATRDDQPWSFEISGEGKVVEVPLASAKIKYIHGRRVELQGSIDFTIGGYGVQSAIENAWATFDAFNLEGRGSLSLPGLGIRDAVTVVSSRGLSSCFGPEGSRFGFGWLWKQKRQEFGAGKCDVGPYRAPLAVQATAAQTGTRRFTLRDGVNVIEATGRDAPPDIELVGPNVRVATPPGDAGIDRADVMLVQDPDRRTTTIVLRHATRGGYRLVPMPAATAPIRVRTAGALPAPRIRARVTSAARSRRTLRWSLRRLPGQDVTFVERHPTGVAVLRRTRAASGRIAFVPTPGRGGARTIEAQIAQNDLPRATLTVARYRFTPPPLRRVTRIRRSGSRLRWQTQPAASGYAVAVYGTSGKSVTFTVRRPRAKMPAGLGRGKTVISIVAIGADGLHGPRTTVTR